MKVAILVEDPGQAASHACSEIEAGGAKDDGEASGHVFAAVIADTFDDGQGSGVADGEALAGAAGGEEGSAGSSVERDVAKNDVQFGLEGGAALAAKDDFAAGEALADEVIRHALQDKLHSWNGEGSKGLAGDAGHFEGERCLRIRPVSVEHSELAGETRAEGAVFVGDERVEDKMLAVTVSSEGRLDPRIVDGRTVGGTRIATALPMGLADRRRCQDRRKV